VAQISSSVHTSSNPTEVLSVAKRTVASLAGAFIFIRRFSLFISLVLRAEAKPPVVLPFRQYFCFSARISTAVLTKNVNQR